MVDRKSQTEKTDRKPQVLTVLVVDDDLHVLQALERLLQRYGYEVIIAVGGERALTALDKHAELAAVICDYWMPGVSGAEVLTSARAKHPDAARIAITGDVHANTVLECLNSGMASHMQMKPWEDSALLQTVREALSLRQLRLENTQLKQLAAQQTSEVTDEKPSQATETEQGIIPAPDEIQRLEDTVQDLVALSAFLLDLQSGSKGHSKRVAQLSSWLAQVKGLPAEEVKQIETAALLKDLGQIAVPSQPTQAEAGDDPPPEAVQQLLGVQLLKKIAGFEQIAEMVSGFHEEGGSGEPGTALGSDILAVANTFDSQMYPTGDAVVRRPAAAERFLTEKMGNELNEDLVNTFREQVIPSYVAAEDNVLEVSVEQLQPGMVIARDVISVRSVPLLFSGTELAEADIASLKRNKEFNAIFSRIFIKVDSVPRAEDEPPDPEPVLSPDDPAYVDPRSRVVRGTPEEKPPDEKPPLVVIIDDDQAVTAALQRELHSAGYRVLCFNDPFKGLAHIRYSKDVFALISDYRMPGLMGHELLAKVQLVRPNLPCVVITAVATGTTVERLIKSAKIVRILPKPWDKSVLLKTLKGLA